MGVRKSFRVVEPDETPVPVKILTLAEAIESGEYVEILLATRRGIAADLPEAQGPAKAALYRQLTVLSKEIEALLSRDPNEDEGGANVDDGEFDAEAI